MPTFRELIDAAAAADVFDHAEYFGMTKLPPVDGMLDPDEEAEWPAFYTVQGQNEGWLIFAVDHASMRRGLVAKFLGGMDEPLEACQKLLHLAYPAYPVYARHAILPAPKVGFGDNESPF